VIQQPFIKTAKISNICGRILMTQPPNTLYIGYKHKIYRSTNFGNSWDLIGILPVSFARRLSSPVRLFRRLLRYELRSFAISKNGSMLASSREGVYWAATNNTKFYLTSFLDCCNRLIYSPMTITADCEGRFIWGEYTLNRLRCPVGIYVSYDGGRTRNLSPILYSIL
jgi:hypothetical protein